MEENGLSKNILILLNEWGRTAKKALFDEIGFSFFAKK